MFYDVGLSGPARMPPITARPIALAAPVTNAAFPLNSLSVVSSVTASTYRILIDLRGTLRFFRDFSRLMGRFSRFGDG